MANDKKLSISFASKSSFSSSRPNLKCPSPFEDSSAAAAASPTTITNQFVTVFDPSQTPITAPNLIIAPIPNSDFRQASTKRMKNLDVPSAPHHQEQQFVVEANSSAPSDNISYGLTLRSNGAAGDGDSKPQQQEEDLTLRRFKEDMKNLPEDRGFDEFKDVPIEGFGAAILAGYGWTEGKGIGRNSKADTKVVQYDRRAGTQGLGYEPSVNGSIVKVKKGKEMVYVVNKSKDSEAKKEKREVREKREERGEKEDRKSHSHSSHRESREGREKSMVRWLTSHIRVRVISEDLKGGRWYLKKGKVVDVVGPTTCDISIDGSRELVQGVDQEFLETALPKPGGPVLVLYGKHKGVYGSLVEKDMKKETGVVEDADSHEMIRVWLDQIAEYVGDRSYLGY